MVATANAGKPFAKLPRSAFGWGCWEFAKLLKEILRFGCEVGLNFGWLDWLDVGWGIVVCCVVFVVCCSFNRLHRKVFQNIHRLASCFSSR